MARTRTTALVTTRARARARARDRARARNQVAGDILDAVCGNAKDAVEAAIGEEQALRRGDREGVAKEGDLAAA